MTKNHILTEGIQKYQEGHPKQASALFAQLVRQNPDNLNAWIWLARCVKNDHQREYCEKQIQRILNKNNNMVEQKLETPKSAKTSQVTRNPGSKEKVKNIRLRGVLLSGLLIFCFAAGGVYLMNHGHSSSVFASEAPPVIASVADQPTLQEISAESSQAKRAENVQLTTYLPGLFVAQPTAIPPAQDVSNVEANSELSESLPEKLNPKKWKSWPVTPLISANAVEIYQLGVTNGNDPQAFSILGDCLSEPAILFERFADASYLENPEYKTYRKTLRYFSGSWDRYFVTVANGMTVASAFSPAWARNSLCQSGESPLDCEFRLHNPSILVISLGTNWGGRDPDEYENYLRKIVIYALDRNVLPVIATKGDPAGPNNPLNERMVQVAYEFDIPLWNFWAAIQEMPNQGLNPWDGLGGVHLSPEAWTVKRNTGLMALDVLRRTIQDEN